MRPNKPASTRAVKRGADPPAAPREALPTARASVRMRHERTDEV
jgi:hypothetical protein